MKSFNILFSILAIVVFATGCMHKEKELLAPNQPELRQTIQNQTIQENKGGDDIMQTCPAPTNITDQILYFPNTTMETGNRKYSWLPPLQQVSFYRVKFYQDNNLIINTTVTNPEIIVPFPNPFSTYSIEVRSSCSNNTMSLPLVLNGGGGSGGSGGPTVVVMGELNDYTSPNGLFNSVNYVHNINYNNANYSIFADNLYAASGSGSASSITVTPSTVTGTALTGQFTVPLATGLKNTECTYIENNISKYYLDMKVKSPGATQFPQNTLIAYQELTTPLSTQWVVINDARSQPKSVITLYKLKRGKTYRVKIFESISTFNSLTAITSFALPCSSSPI